MPLLLAGGCPPVRWKIESRRVAVTDRPASRDSTAKYDLAQDVELVRAISGNFRDLIKDKSGINIGGCKRGQGHLLARSHFHARSQHREGAVLAGRDRSPWVLGDAENRDGAPF